METGTTLLTPEVTTLINGFGADLVVTVIALIGILVPTGLTLWAIAFGVKKGIAYLQRRAAKAI